MRRAAAPARRCHETGSRPPGDAPSCSAWLDARVGPLSSEKLAALDAALRFALSLA